MDQTKALEKKSVISEDDVKTWSDDIQKLTDTYIKRIDTMFADKDKEIRTV